ncbi:hypothetical protein BGZ63DRAFT_398306 [Mariannaea sp. PMI_226]|nr:hypothetical protein BGZ63DRAFT_398306 [Mariannaea sp. PMI_226]
MECSRNSSRLEQLISPLQPPDQGVLGKIYKHYGLTPFPEAKLYDSDRMQACKTHQIVDTVDILGRAISLKRHLFSSNEIGTGKTKTFLGTIVTMSRVKETKGDKAVFRPSLILTPVNSVFQTYKEARDNFPDLNLYVYYGSQSSFPDKKARVIPSSKLGTFLCRLAKSSDRPSTGRTIIFSTYPTWSIRTISKIEQKLLWKPGKGPRGVRDSIPQDPSSPGEGPEPDSEKPKKKKIRRFRDGQVNLDDIIILSPSSSEPADGNLITYRAKIPNVTKFKFEFVVADEAQNAKKADGVYNQMLRILHYHSLLWVTGTPLSELGYLLGLYSDSYDPHLGLRTEEGDETAAIFSGDQLEPGLEKVKFIYDKYAIRLWILHPQLYTTTRQQFSLESAFSHLVIHPIFRSKQIRRTMTSKIVLPDGKICYQAENLPPSVIRFEELDFSLINGDHILMRQYGHKLTKALFTSSVIGDIPDFTAQKAPNQTDSNRQLNFGIHCQGILTTFDPRNIRLFLPTSDFRGNKNDIMKLLRQLRDDGAITTAQAAHLEAAGHRKGPVIGVAHVEKLIQSDTLDGLTYFYLQARDPCYHVRHCWLQHRDCTIFGQGR